MIYLTLRDSDKTREAIMLFTAILAAYQLEIIEQLEDREEGTIDLTISHCNFPLTRTVSGVVQDLFGKTVRRLWFN